MQTAPEPCWSCLESEILAQVFDHVHEMTATERGPEMTNSACELLQVCRQWRLVTGEYGGTAADQARYIAALNHVFVADQVLVHSITLHRAPTEASFMTLLDRFTGLRQLDIVGLEAQGQPKLGAKCLGQLTALRKLEGLAVFAEISDGLQAVFQLTTLQWLRLSFGYGLCEGLLPPSSASSLVLLTHLDLKAKCDIDAASTDFLSSLPSLQDLSLGRHVLGPTVHCLQGLTQLTKLSMGNFFAHDFPRAVFQALQGFSQLAALRIVGEIADDDIDVLCSLPKLLALTIDVWHENEVCQLDSLVKFCNHPSLLQLSCVCLDDDVMYSASLLHQEEEGYDFLMTSWPSQSFLGLTKYQM